MRLSVTTVEAFRLWRDTGDWMALETLERQIRREEPPNEKMLRGRAFHDVLERPRECFIRDQDGGHYESGGYSFSGDGMNSVLTHIPPDRVPEVKAEVVIDGVTLVGKADALHGLTAYEFKFTERVDVENYFDSFQWRAYLQLFGITRVRYLLCQGKDGGGFLSVYSVLPMDMYRYPSVSEDVRRLTADCAKFITERGLTDYVQDKAA